MNLSGEDVAVATGIATAIATSISLLVSLWWRRTDRKEADWITFQAKSRWSVDTHGNTHQPHASCVLANVGDASAFRVRAVGYGCHATLGTRYDSQQGRQTFELAPSVPSGDNVDLTTWCAPSGWDDAFVVLTWVASPTRRRFRSRRSMSLLLQEISAPPNFDGVRKTEQDPVTLELRPVLDPDLPAAWEMPAWTAADTPLGRFKASPVSRLVARRRMRRKAFR